MKYSFNNQPIKCMQTNSTCYKQTRHMEIKGILWHSTGANNPNIKRYVQPSENDSNYNNLIKLIGKNTSKSDWNHITIQAGLNAWIGKLANGAVTTVQTMPWNYRPWGCGKGPRGTCNDGWIQFEICEDALVDQKYFNAVYEEACQLTAYLCQLYNIDPLGTVTLNGVKVPTILCHADSYTLGLGSNHGDVNHWFSKFGKSMVTARQDVYNLLHIKTIIPNKPTVATKVEEEEEMTQEQFNKMMDNYLTNLAKQPPSDWSKGARDWCESIGLIAGDAQGNKMYKKFITREEMAALLFKYNAKK